jgi:hypothetical protein
MTLSTGAGQLAPGPSCRLQPEANARSTRPKRPAPALLPALLARAGGCLCALRRPIRAHSASAQAGRVRHRLAAHVIGIWLKQARQAAVVEAREGRLRQRWTAGPSPLADTGCRW